MPTTIDTGELTLDSDLSVTGAPFGDATIVALNPSGLGFQTPRASYLTGSAASFLLSIFDEDGEPFVPNALTYQIDDLLSGAEILVPTTIPAAASATIVISPAQNAMISVSRPRETHQLTVNITDGQRALYRRRTLFTLVRSP